MAKEFIAYNRNAEEIFRGIGGDVNAWAKRNVPHYEDIYVDYYGEGQIIGHWYMGVENDIWGGSSIVPMCEFIYPEAA